MNFSKNRAGQSAGFGNCWRTDAPDEDEQIRRFLEKKHYIREVEKATPKEYQKLAACTGKKGLFLRSDPSYDGGMSAFFFKTSFSWY